jgi:hypothetical protein
MDLHVAIRDNGRPEDPGAEAIAAVYRTYLRTKAGVEINDLSGIVRKVKLTLIKV